MVVESEPNLKGTRSRYGDASQCVVVWLRKERRE